tara:strand:+ start:4045 stop:5340 length:1296 start_codon:yes stop_codon:yes gene_type:complete
MAYRDFSLSDDLYRKTLQSIPLATQTHSKSALNFPKGVSPNFFNRGAGAIVWDVDDNRYVDYVLGLLPIVLGYQDPDVDKAIRTQLDKGIIFSLATELELELAERLLELIPCADMVRFGKNGSDVTAAAIRLARAHTGRDRVAVCGYHGWHDWYIGTTTRNLGVPEAVQSLSSQFKYNDVNSIESLLSNDPDGFAAIILEPAGMEDPRSGFLKEVRELANFYGSVLIFDEIITGFRIDLGGAQKFYGVTPDLACFGKAMANGMPIAALVGRAEIMTHLEKIFFSTTFGGEALSLAAAIATIDKLKATDATKRMSTLGARLKSMAREVLNSLNLTTRFNVGGPDWRPVVTSRDKNPILATSLLRQELIENGIFMGSAFNLCLAHDDDQVFANTKSAWKQAMYSVSKALSSSNPADWMRGELIQPVFQVRPKS